MQLADSGLMLQMPTISQLETGIQSSSTANSSGSSSGSFWSGIGTDLANIGTTALQVWGGVKQAQAYQAAGIRPAGYSAYGQPIYASTPAGVTPANPFSLPSGMALPAGVTPGYNLTPGSTTIATGTVNPIANFLASPSAKYLMYGSAAIFVLLMLQKKRRRA